MRKIVITPACHAECNEASRTCGIILLSVILTLFLCFSAKSQNLVPNNSFENFTICPPVISKLYFAPPWFQPSTYYGNVTNSSSSDLFNSCSSTSSTNVPHNTQGFQYARTGNGYAGVISHGDTVNYREYIEVPLLDTLISSHNYCVEFYVSLANNYGTAISNIGSYFSNDSLLANNYHAINSAIPQVENSVSNMLSDTLNWLLVSGDFVAAGGEKFMTIGNFYLPVNTNSQVVNIATAGESYYYIDDVSVVDCTGEGVGDVSATLNNLAIYPNPTAGELRITNYELGIKEVRIYNVLGQEVNRQQATGNSATIDLTGFAKGVYFAEVQTGTSAGSVTGSASSAGSMTTGSPQVKVIRKKIIKE